MFSEHIFSGFFFLRLNISPHFSVPFSAINILALHLITNRFVRYSRRRRMLRESEDLPQRQMSKHPRFVYMRVSARVHGLAGRDVLHGYERVREETGPLQKRQMREHRRLVQMSLRLGLQAVARPTKLHR